MKKYIFITVLLLFPCLRAHAAATFYVSTTGSDSANCSINTPCATINHASSLTNPGDTVRVLPGTYNLVSATCINTSAPNVTYISDTKGAAKINGQQNCTNIWHDSGASAGNVIIDGFDFTGAINTSNLGGGAVAILLEGAIGNYTFRNNTVHDMGTNSSSTNIPAAFEVGSFGGGNYTNRTCSVHDNVFFNIAVGFNQIFGGYAMYIICNNNGGGDPDPQIYNNVIYNVGSIGIQTWHAANHYHIYNNTLDRVYLGITVGTGDQGCILNAVADVRNNVVTHSGLIGINADDGNPGTCQLSSTSTFNNNDLFGNATNFSWNAGTFSSHFTNVNNILVDPLYVSPGTTLGYDVATNSPVNAAGITNANTPTLDFSGITRPNPPSIGAFEAQGGNPPPPPPPPTGGSISLINHCLNSSDGTAVASIGCSFVGVGGDLLVVSCGSTNTTAANNILDSVSNSYTTLFSRIDTARGFNWYNVWYVIDSTGGNITFTCTPASPAGTIIEVSEWRGIQTTNPLDVSTSTLSDGSTSCTTSSITSTNPNDLFVITAMNNQFGGTFTSYNTTQTPNVFQFLDQDLGAGKKGADSYMIFNTIGTTAGSVGFNGGAGANWFCSIQAFKGNAAGTGSTQSPSTARVYSF